MYQLARNSILILATISFLAMVTGLTLTLHLSSYKHHGNRDSDHCLTCQQLSTALKEFALEPEPKLYDADHFKHYVQFYPATYIQRLYRQPFNPRPPPPTP